MTPYPPPFTIPASPTLYWVSLAVPSWITPVSGASHGLMPSSTWLYLDSLSGTKSAPGVFVTQSRSGLQARGGVWHDWDGACSVYWKGDVRRGNGAGLNSKDIEK